MIMTLRPNKYAHEATNIFFINAESVICDLLISSGEGSFDEELTGGCGGSGVGEWDEMQ